MSGNGSGKGITDLYDYNDMSASGLKKIEIKLFLDRMNRPCFRIVLKDLEDPANKTIYRVNTNQHGKINISIEVPEEEARRSIWPEELSSAEVEFVCSTLKFHESRIQHILRGKLSEGTVKVDRAIAIEQFLNDNFNTGIQAVGRAAPVRS